MRRKKFGNKGEMTSKMLVTIILLVIGFGIILLLYSRLAFSETIDSEVCHESVILRGTLPSTLGLRASAPLKCQTEKICVRGKKSFDKGECEEFANVDSFTNNDVDDITQIERLISQKIVECWGMMGEGKISIFSQHLANTYAIGDVYPSCVICSRIAFDKPSLLERGVDIEERDVLNYMLTHKIPGKEKSYYDYLAGEGPAKISVQESISVPGVDSQGNLDYNNSIEIDLTEPSGVSGDTEELAILFMQISAPSASDVFGNSLEALGGGILGYGAVTGVGGISLAGNLAGKACLGLVRGAICVGVAVIAMGLQQYSAYDNRDIAATRCGDVSTGDASRKGCTVVRAVEYDVEEIKQYCSVIESIP